MKRLLISTALIGVIITPCLATELLNFEDLRQARPRMLMLDADLNTLKSDYAVGGQPTTRWIDALKAQADSILNQPVLQYPGPDDDILDQSRALMHRAYILGFMHRWSGEASYAERLWEDLKVAALQPTWRPHVQFLSTAEMLHGFAISYDWLHHYWSESRREVLREAIVEKGLRAGISAYRGKLPGYAGWDSKHNWNIVCNGALLLAVTSILPDEKELAQEVAKEALARIPRLIGEFGKDGGWAEGPTYWGYTLNYLGTTLSALDTAWGSDFGLSSLNPGLALTGDFAMHMTSNTGLPFNFADSEKGRPRSHGLFELARRFHRPEFARYQALNGEGNPRDIAALSRALHLRSEWNAYPAPPLQKYFSGVGVWAARSSWSDPGASFIAMKAGFNGANHGHLDLGSFVLDALGHRWVHDLDKDSYNSPGFFETSEAGRRWLYYAIRAEGHNTLVINPSADKPDQFVRAKSRTIAHESDITEAFFIVDLTDAYLPDAKRVWRGARLTDSRSRVYIQDEVNLLKPGDIVWAIHVRDPITLSSDGREATLTTDHRRLVITLQEPLDAKFEILPAAPLVPIKRVPQRANPDFQKLVVRLLNRDSATIGVWFSPMPATLEPPFLSNQDFGALSDWTLDPREPAILESLTLDGMPVHNFQPSVFSVWTENIGEAKLSFRPEDSAVKLVSAPTGQSETTWYLRAASESKRPTLYQLRVHKALPPPLVLESLPSRAHYKVSGTGDGIHRPENVTDGNLTTRWSAEGANAQLLINKGGLTEKISGVAIAFMKGDSRRYSISVEISNDGEIFQEVLPKTLSSGRTLEAEFFVFSEPVTGRFVRITGYGNNENGWTSITEVVLLTRKD